MGFFICVISLSLLSCGGSKKIRTGAGKLKNDTTLVESAHLKEKALQLLGNDSQLTFETFSADAKVEYSDENGSQPDVIAHIRMKKDEFIWISLTATFLNFEAARVLITPDSIVIVNKLEKVIQVRPMSYIREKIALPLAFSDVQKLILGKIILADDSVRSVFASEDFLHFNSDISGANNDIYYTLNSLLLTRQVVSVHTPELDYSAEVFYDNYEKNGDQYFSLRRDITIPAMEQHVRLTFRQYVFNKELSTPFPRPDGYKIK